MVRRGLVGGGAGVGGHGCCGHGGRWACSMLVVGVGRTRQATGAMWGRADLHNTKSSGLFVDIAGRGFVGVSGALRSTKTQQWQFARARDLRAAAAVHAAAPVSYHRQWVRSLRVSRGAYW